MVVSHPSQRNRTWDSRVIRLRPGIRTPFPLTNGSSNQLVLPFYFSVSGFFFIHWLIWFKVALACFQVQALAVEASRQKRTSGPGRSQKRWAPLREPYWKLKQEGRKFTLRKKVLVATLLARLFTSIKAKTCLTMTKKIERGFSRLVLLWLSPILLARKLPQLK